MPLPNRPPGGCFASSRVHSPLLPQSSRYLGHVRFMIDDIDNDINIDVTDIIEVTGTMMIKTDILSV
jgi:hypothetical protein